MKFKMNRFIIIFLCAISLPAISVTPPSPEGLSQKAIFNNWLIDRCIGKIDSESKLMDDAFKSAAVWLELSKLPVEAFNEGDILIEEYLRLKLDGSVKSNYNVLKCTLLLSSGEAISIFDKYYTP